MFVLWAAMLRVQILHFALWATLESGYPVNTKHTELERSSAHQLRLKAVEMPRSSTQLVKSHGDDLDLEYLRNGDEYGSLENSLKAMEKNAEYGGQPEILAQVHVIERLITVHCEGSDEGTEFESNGEKRRIWRTTRNLSPSACYRETNHCSLWRFRRRHWVWKQWRKTPNMEDNQKS